MPLLPQLCQVLSELWASHDFGDENLQAPNYFGENNLETAETDIYNHTPTYASALAMAFRLHAHRNSSIPGNLSNLTNLSTNLHFLRYTHLTTHKNNKQVLMANLDFFISWTMVDSSPEIAARALRESLVSQSVSCIMSLDSEPSEPLVISFVRNAAPSFWAYMLQLGLDSDDQNAELEKSITLGMVST